MKTILICILLAMTYNSEVLAQEGWYISPGVQIGIDSNGDLHRAAQITLGILTEEYPFTTGLTIGYKWFRKLIIQMKKVGNDIITMIYSPNHRRVSFYLV